VTRIAIVLAMVGAVMAGGCQNQAAIKALQDSTALLSDQATKLDQQLVELSKTFATCTTRLSRYVKQPATTEAEKLEVPTFTGEPKVKALEEYKTALTDLIAKQEARLTELKTAGEKCAVDLAAARKKAAAAAKPTAVKQAEKAGTTTTGMGTRYKKR
jgi:hypothetical protein